MKNQDSQIILLQPPVFKVSYILYKYLEENENNTPKTDYQQTDKNQNDSQFFSPKPFDEEENISTFSKISHSIISKKLPSGKKKINQYIVMKVIGKGSFGKVKLVLNTEENNKSYAMKTIQKKKRMLGPKG